MVLVLLEDDLDATLQKLFWVWETFVPDGRKIFSFEDDWCWAVPNNLPECSSSNKSLNKLIKYFFINRIWNVYWNRIKEQFNDEI